MRLLFGRMLASFLLSMILIVVICALLFAFPFSPLRTMDQSMADLLGLLIGVCCGVGAYLLIPWRVTHGRD